MTTSTISANQTTAPSLKCESLNGINRRVEPLKIPVEEGSLRTDSTIDLPPREGRSERYRLVLQDRDQRRVTIYELFNRLKLKRSERLPLIQSVRQDATSVDDLNSAQLRGLHKILLLQINEYATLPEGEEQIGDVKSEGPAVADALPEPESPVEDRIHDAFERVALSYACTLEMLLEETRRCGILDSDVFETIRSEESNVSYHLGGDRQFRCCRSGVGQFYLERDSGTGVGSMASVYELFAELDLSTGENEDVAASVKSPEPVIDDPDQFTLSEALKGNGHEFTELEALIINAAQTLNKKFKKGSAVSELQVRRVVAHLCHGLRRDNITAAMQGLAERGVCSDGWGRFRLVAHVGNQTEESNSAFSGLVAEELHEALLIACDHCVGVGFKNRNVAARAAVWSLMQSRFGLSRRAFKRLVRDVVAAGVLEVVPSHGSTALRLTVKAAALMTGNAMPFRSLGGLSEAIDEARRKECVCGQGRYGRPKEGSGKFA